MQNEQNHPSQSSRRPISQVKETEGQEDPASPQNVFKSSLPGSSWSKSWTAVQSLSSHNLQAFSHRSEHDSRLLPSPATLFPDVTDRHAYQRQYYRFISSHRTQTQAAQFPDIPESQGRHLPYHDLTQQESLFAEEKGTSLAERYHERTAHDLGFHPAPTQSFPTSHPPSHQPFRRSYGATGVQVRYEPYHQRTVPPSSILGFGSIPRSPLVSTPSDEISPNAVQPPAVARPTQHMSLPTYVPDTRYGARSLPNVDKPPWLTLEYSVVEQQGQHIGPVQTAHQLETPADRRQLDKPMEKRRKPPEPFTSFAIMLADIIRNSPRKKMTLQELYCYLTIHYPDCFPDDGIDNQTAQGKSGYSGGWKVQLPIIRFSFTDAC